MTKTEFLQQLYNHLLPLSQSERNDIISDFEEHFAVGLESGKTEEQICKELGDPYTCALQYLRQTGSERTKAETVPPVVPVPKPAEQSYYGAQKGNPQRNRILWGILFFGAALVALGVYPAAVGLMLAFVAILVASAVTATITSSFVVFGFLFSLGLFLFALGLMMCLVMTWFLKLSWQRADL